jgi:hypothetical protein
MCCDNPIELECISSCDDLVLPYTVTESFTVKTTFNGAQFNVPFVANSNSKPVLDKSDLNEDYTYIFGIYNSAGTNVACYKIRINPVAICCDEDTALEKVIMDVVNLNSDTFLTYWAGAGNHYKYQCVACTYNGKQLDLGIAKKCTSTDLAYVAVQVAPRDTIPEHTTDNYPTDFLTYDKRFIDFLNTLEIADYLTFSPSPFGGSNGSGPLADRGYPSSEVEAATDPLANNTLYGEGFQIEYPKDAEFSFTIEFSYSPGTTEYIVGHTVVYKHDSYYIDGAKVFPANMRIIPNV